MRAKRGGRGWADWIVVAGVMMVFCALMTGFWVAAKAKGWRQAGYVETRAERTRFDAPVRLERGPSVDRVVVPVHFTYRVGENNFSGSDMMDQTIFERWPPQLGGGFRVWYDPASPATVVRSRSAPAWDAALAGWLALIAGAVALILAAIGWRQYRRNLGA